MTIDEIKHKYYGETIDDDVIERIYNDIISDGMKLVYEECKSFSDLKGKVITKISGMKEGSERVYFTLADGSEYLMYHSQDCCEHVSLCDVCGEVDDLIGEPVAMAYEASQEGDGSDYGSSTWTFYNIATRKGYVSLRWLGESNGYYSERVDWMRTK